MNRMKYNVIQMLIAMSIITVSAAVADDLEMTRWTIDGGGSMHSTGGNFELSGTIGQPDAGTMSNGNLSLTGGFWLQTPPGDCNDTGCVDLLDYDGFEPCLSGPAGTPPTGNCRCYDMDTSQTVDLQDFARFQTRIPS